MQLKEESFRELVSGRGCSYEHGGPASPKLACKLKALKQDMKQWNREVFDNIATCKACALDSIRRWDVKKRVAYLLMSRTQDIQLFKKCSKLAVMEESSSRQKSHNLWLKGAKTTILFF